MNFIAFHRNLAAKALAAMRAFFLPHRNAPPALLSSEDVGSPGAASDAWMHMPASAALGENAPRAILMRELGVGFNGERYTCAENQFDKLIDAIRHAQVLQGIRPPPPELKE